MPVDISFEYNKGEDILFAKITGTLETEQDALDTFEKIKKKIETIGKKCWFVSDVRALSSKSGPAIKYSKLSSSLGEKWFASISIVTSFVQKSGMKLVGTFRRKPVHLASSREEALTIIKKLKTEV